jgi:hypothetical protein
MNIEDKMSDKVSEPKSKAAPQLFKRLKRDQDGVAAIEMAFIFPVMLILYFGLVDATNLLSANRRVTLTSSTIADLVTQAAATVTTAELDGYFNATKHIMEPFDHSQMGMEMFSYGFDPAANDEVLLWEYRSSIATGADGNAKQCGTAPSITSEMETLMASGNGLVLARVCYDWSSVSANAFGFDAVTVEDQMILRPRQSSIIECSDCP